MDTRLVWMWDWMARTENQLLTSSSMTSLESSTILSTFKEIISLSPSCDQMCSMVRLMSLFLTWMGSETEDRESVHSVVEITQLLLTHHTHLDTDIQIQEQIGALVVQCAQVQVTWTHLVLDGVTGHILHLVSQCGLLSGQGKVWLTTLHRLLMEETEEELRDSLRKDYIGLVEELVDGLYICGDFTTQTRVVEILLR